MIQNSSFKISSCNRFEGILVFTQTIVDNSISQYICLLGRAAGVVTVSISLEEQLCIQLKHYYVIFICQHYSLINISDGAVKLELVTNGRWLR